MAKSINMKEKIINCAYELFAKNGYPNTTVDQIIEAAECAKGTFYHYFANKDALLLNWVSTYDQAYEEWYNTLPEDMDAVEKLAGLSEMSFGITELYSDPALSSTVYAYQLSCSNDANLIGRDRYFTKLLHMIIKEGQEKGEIRKDISYIELAKMFNAIQKGITYEWCVTMGAYSIKEFGKKTMKMFLEKFR